MYDLLITNGTVIDGTGSAPFRADVAVSNGVICAVGKLDGAQVGRVVDAAGKLITPGFIDAHSHADITAARFPGMENLTLQGVTTVCAGNCSMGVAPLTGYYMHLMCDSEAMEQYIPPLMTGLTPQMDVQLLAAEEARAAFRDAYGVALDWSSWAEFYEHLERGGIGANMMCLVGHAMLRVQVMGEDCCRAAGEDEISEMCALLRRCMEEGACGLSYGFDYAPGSFAREDELLALAHVAAEYGGILSAHVQHSALRYGRMHPGFQPYQGFREFLEIGRKTGVKLRVSHLRVPFKPVADRHAASAAAGCLLKLFEEYRAQGVQVTWDVLPNYPVAGESRPMLASKLQCYVERCGSLTRFGEMLHNDWYLAHLRKELLDGANTGKDDLYGFDINTPDWDAMWVITKHANGDYMGKSIRALAEQEKRDPLDMLLHLLKTDVYACARLEAGQKDLIGFADFVNQPDATIGLDIGSCSYGCNVETREDMPPHYLGSYSDFCGMIWLLKHPDVRVSREQLIAAMTGRTAIQLGLRDRGFVREGMKADLLVLDWEKLDPNIDHVRPDRAPMGVSCVFVNGVLCAQDGKALDVRAGQVIRNEERVRG